MVQPVCIQIMQDSNSSVRLVGVGNMPKAASKLSLDFSSLLGTLFFMWLLQLLLPVFVYTIVHEKELHLRLKMRMHGLSDGCVSIRKIQDDIDWYTDAFTTYAVS